MLRYCGLYLDLKELRYKGMRQSDQTVLTFPFDGRGRVIGIELRCIPPIFLEPCWGLKWCPKYHARRPSDYDIGVLAPDGKYNSLKIGGPPDMEHGARDSIENLNPSPSPLRTIHDTDGQLGLRRRGPPSPPSWHFSILMSPVPSIVHERTQDQPDFMHSVVTPTHSSVRQITSGRTEGTLPSIQPHSEPYTSELSYALLPGPFPHSSQNYRAPTVGTPQHLSPQIQPAVSQDPDSLLYSVAPDNDASLERFISAQAADAQAYLPPNTIGVHSTPQVCAMTMQTPQTTLPDPWNSLDFSPVSATPMSCSTSFSADCSLFGEFEQDRCPGVATPMSELMRMGLENSPQSNVQSETGMPDEYWQLIGNATRSSPRHQSRGLSPIDMGVYQLPGTSEGEETAYYLSDTCLFSSGFGGTFAF
ncbi:hypothetical protein DFH29DRAFT_20474 [Suillus ampliporus]|nr:hypothetical protein DFH29DRAFT_20474 [Suillus ampliporus]